MGIVSLHSYQSVDYRCTLPSIFYQPETYNAILLSFNYLFTNIPFASIFNFAAKFIIVRWQAKPAFKNNRE